jgi:hypothetical protein
VVVVFILRVVVRVARPRCRLRHRAGLCGRRRRRRGKRQVPVQLRRQDPAPPHRRHAALRRRRQPGPLRRPSHPVLRCTFNLCRRIYTTPLNNPLISLTSQLSFISIGSVAAEAEGIVRRLGSAPAVSATDGGPGRAHLRHLRRRPRQAARGVRRG